MRRANCEDSKLTKPMRHDEGIVSDVGLVGIQVDSFYQENSKWTNTDDIRSLRVITAIKTPPYSELFRREDQSRWNTMVSLCGVGMMISALTLDGIMELQEKLELNSKVMPLIDWVFQEPNPIGVNTALAQLGVARPVFRLPYVPLPMSKRVEFVKLVEEIGRSIL
ncbi:hypothetical protein Bca52824_078076 [Brassica carinata]|uniref:4-hydroxy-tetrahydrodipicolinate synthase n=1 Tax=Brassica carinata TaxID=52824 RepID=A0A8X7TY70_BRACI|nr:hypothetical protein Bca52824_078076 [Brassica carinata]